MLQRGDFAPDFECPALVGGVRRPFRLSEWLRDGCVLLTFYPNNWDPSTARLLIEYQAHRPEFLAAGVETIAIGVDSIMNTVAWEREIGPFDFPWAADFWPHGVVSQSFGVLRRHEPFRAASQRALFYVSKLGQIEFSKLFPIDEAPEPGDAMQIVRHLNGQPGDSRTSTGVR